VAARALARHDAGMKVAVTGASGLLGRALVPLLRAQGHDVVRLVRGTPDAPDERGWDPATGRLDPSVLEDVDAVVHLAGEGVASHRWTAAHKQRVLRSRVDGTTAVARAVAASPRTRVLVSASAVGWYGDTGDRLTDETGASGRGFLADVVRQWEAATAPAEQAGARVVHARTGLVLAADGGALAPVLRVTRLGLGAPLGSGRQWWPWISLPDEVAALTHCLVRDEVSGPVNVVAPNPVTNREFQRTLGRVLRRPTLPVPVPGFVLRAVLGGFADEGVLSGQRLEPAALLRTGFVFAHPDLEPALRAVLQSGRTSTRRQPSDVRASSTS
jgi:uncharacterized protein (TIGR01777 family)